MSRRCLKNHFSHQFKNVPSFLLRDARHLASDIKLEPRIIKNKNIKGEKNMKIRLNENEKVVKMVKEGLKKKNGYCPCRLEMNEDTKCMCKEFREQIADENFEGYCHCMLYYKEK